MITARENARFLIDDHITKLILENCKLTKWHSLPEEQKAVEVWLNLDVDKKKYQTGLYFKEIKKANARTECLTEVINLNQNADALINSMMQTDYEDEKEARTDFITSCQAGAIEYASDSILELLESVIKENEL